MRKFTSIILAAAMVLTLAGCSSEDVRQGEETMNAETSAAAETAEVVEITETAEADSSAAENAEAEVSDAAEVTDTVISAPSAAPAEPNEAAAEYEGGKGAPGDFTETEPVVTDEYETTESDQDLETEEIIIVLPETVEAETVEAETTEAETEEAETSESGNEQISDPAALLNNAWALFGEDERFAVTGGDFSSGELIEEAAAFGLGDPDSLDYVTGFPAAEITKIDSAANLMHMMNQNTFTAGAYHVVDAADMAALSQAIRDNIQNRMWMCGFPDKLIVVNVGDYIVSAFGKEQQINAFAAHLTEAYPTATVVFDETIL